MELIPTQQQGSGIGYLTDKNAVLWQRNQTTIIPEQLKGSEDSGSNILTLYIFSQYYYFFITLIVYFW